MSHLSYWDGVPKRVYRKWTKTEEKVLSYLSNPVPRKSLHTEINKRKSP